MKQRHVPNDERGAAAMEFALAAPVLFSIVIGATQFATIFFANAGVQHAVASGARAAAIFPTPDDATIKAAVSAERFGLNPANVVGEPAVVRRTDDNDNAVIDVTLNYTVPVDFVFFNIADVPLSQTRTVFVHNGDIFNSGEAPSGGGGGGGGGGDPTPTPTPTPSCGLLPNGRPRPNC